MQKLVEQLLALAKNKEIQHSESVNITELMEKTIEVFTGAYDRNIELHENGKPIQILGNQDQLRQVFYILIDNALKYSDDNVIITMAPSDNQIAISVRDFGQGIPKEEKERIFERFYRMDKARSRNTGGTGLGLAIAKSIIHSHGGTISVDSRLGEGSTFQVMLPLT